jgi:MFS family permease
MAVLLMALNTSKNNPNISTTPGPYKIVAATGFGVFLSALDGSIVNVSLFTMMEKLGVTQNAIQWVVVAYLIIYTSTMPLMGKFGDRYGKETVFQAGMIVFVTGSLFCALSPILEILIISRVFQAFGAGMMTANGLALVTYFTTNENRGRAIGLNSVILAGALGLGPVLGGILTEFFNWPSIFLVNLPVGIVGYFVFRMLVPPTERVREVKFDTYGAIMFFIVLFFVVYTVSVYESVNIEIILILLAASIIPTKVLKDRRISSSFFSALLAYMAMVPISYQLPFFLQDALGWLPAPTGLFLIAFPMMISISGPFAGLLSERMKGRDQTIIGLLIEFFGLLFIGFAVPNPLLIFIGILFLGLGLSLFTVANGNFIMTSAPREYMGVVSALTNISRTTGFSIAIATITSLFSVLLGTFQVTLPYSAAYQSSYQLTTWLFTIFVIAAIFISAFRGRSPAEGGDEILCDPIRVT